MYACVCIYKSIYESPCFCVCMYTHLQFAESTLYTFPFVTVHIRRFIRLNPEIYVHTHTFIHIHVYTYIHTCISMRSRHLKY